MVFPVAALRSRSYQLLALALSLLVHLGLFYGVSGRLGIGEKVAAPTPETPGIAIRLIDAADSAAAIKAAVAEFKQVDSDMQMFAATLINDSKAAAEAASNRSAEQASSPAKASQQASNARTPASDYLLAKDLTREARVFDDISTEFEIALPGLPPGPADVRLLINEQGEMDDIDLIDTPLSVENRRLLKQIYPKIRFSPGKIGNKPVKSQLQLIIIIKPAAVSSQTVSPVSEKTGRQ